nr:GNAT family N-acetyltransferase [Microbacterium immunditiarum]
MVTEDGRLVGVALTQVPLGRLARLLRLPVVGARFVPVAVAVRPRVLRRLRDYDRRCRALAPRTPHHTLTMVGVRDEARGAGHGRRLIEDAIAMAEADPGSSGIGLDTENPANVALYEHLGFHLLGVVDMGAFRAHVMFHPTSGAEGREHAPRRAAG